jgi:hypothetical protein
VGDGTGRLGFYHWLVLWIYIRQNSKPSTPYDCSLLGQRVYKFFGRLHTDQGFNRNSGFVWCDIFAWHGPGYPDDFVD